MEPHKKEDDSLDNNQGSQEDNLQSKLVSALIVLIHNSHNVLQLRAVIDPWRICSRVSRVSIRHEHRKCRIIICIYIYRNSEAHTDFFLWRKTA
jgi:hypothetical protein